METRFRPYEISPERVDRVAIALESAGMEGILSIERRLDPQYPAARGLALEVGEAAGALYAMLVALVSYRLAMKGEEWWSCFRDLLSARASGRSGAPGLREIVGDVIWFLGECPGAAIRREAKVKRIRTLQYRGRRILERIHRDPEVVLREPDMVAERLARALQVEVWRKTIVFSLKMGYYALGGPDRGIPLKASIPIPVDVRVSCISYSSGVVEASSPEEVLRYPRTAQDAWGMVSSLSGIPPLHIDSVLWVIGDLVRGRDLTAARRLVAERLVRVLPLESASLLAEELIWRPCPSSSSI